MTELGSTLQVPKGARRQLALHQKKIV